MRRFRRVKDVERLVREVPVRLRLFDSSRRRRALIDEPYGERWNALERARGALDTVGRAVPASAATPRRSTPARSRTGSKASW
jgi:ATP-dependent DNA ligase